MTLRNIWRTTTDQTDNFSVVELLSLISKELMYLLTPIVYGAGTSPSTAASTVLV